MMAKAATPASWKKGQSGNPKGAPKRPQSVAAAFRVALSKKSTKRKREKLSILSDQVADAVTLGKVKLEDGRELVVETIRDWRELVKLVQQSIDGMQVNLSGSLLPKQIASMSDEELEAERRKRGLLK